jgi:hypothetical protein
MNHEAFRELLVLSVVGEIRSDERGALDAHLQQCDECRMTIAELQRVMNAIGERRVLEATEPMLMEARRNLAEALRRESPVRSPVVGATGDAASARALPAAARGTWGRVGAWRGFRLAFSGIAAVAVGFFAGYLVFARPSSGPSTVPVPDAAEPIADESTMGRPSIANVRFVRVERGGELELQYDLVRPVRVSGHVSDDRLQRILSYAMVNEDNPGVRLQAINLLDAGPGGTRDNDVEMALVEALKTDPNVGVRKQALRVLRGMRFDPRIKDAFLYVLAHDDNPGMRVSVIDVLAQATLDGTIKGDEVYEVLKSRLASNKDDYLRARSGAFIQEVTDEDQ